MIQFTKKYFSKETMDKMDNAFLDLLQKDMSVKAYENDINKLRKFTGRRLDDEEVHEWTEVDL